MISSIYFLALGVLLVIYFGERIADRGQLKRWMMSCAWLIVMFLFFRMVKYEPLACGIVVASRHADERDRRAKTQSEHPAL